MNIYEEGLKLIRDKKGFALASIIKSTGSTPRSKGTKMIIREDGSIFGTIGGGKMEASCIREGLKSIKNKKSFIYEFNLDNKDYYESEMVCGGNGKILVNYINSEDKNAELVFQIAVKTINSNKKGWIVTVLKGDKRQILFVDYSNNIFGECTSDDLMKSKLQKGVERLSIHSDATDEETYIVEKVHSTGKVFIFGAGHVSKETAAILDIIEFETIVIDDRSEFANKERFPNSQIVVLNSLEDIGDLGVDDDSYILIITRGHLHDYNVLEWALKTNAYYIGMIGSRTKINMTYEKIKKVGFTDKDIERVNAPIGIKLEAKTPGEIGISIAGQLINERAKKEREPF